MLKSKCVRLLEMSLQPRPWVDERVGLEDARGERDARERTRARARARERDGNQRDERAKKPDALRDEK